MAFALLASSRRPTGLVTDDIAVEGIDALLKSWMAKKVGLLPEANQGRRLAIYPLTLLSNGTHSRKVSASVRHK